MKTRRLYQVPREGLLLQLHAGVMYGFLYAPILVLMVFSFSASRMGNVWAGFTVEWYRQMLEDADLMASLRNSLIVAGASTAAATAIGTLAAFGMERLRFRGREALDAVLYLPIVIPDIVMALSLVLFYVLVHLPLGLISIILGHVAFNISFVAVVVRARLKGFDRTLEEAAMDLGADPRQTFLRITLPLIAPGIVAGGLLAFTLSFDDFMIAFFTAGVGATTLPMRVYSMVKFGVTPEINAISTVMLVLTIGVVLLAERLRTGK